MNRIAGIIVAVIGIILIALSVSKFVSRITQTGVVLTLLGALIFGLSFIRKPSAEGSERDSTGNTLVNIFFSPTEAFAALRRHPRWLVAALIMSVMSAVYANLFLYRLTPERVTNYAIDKTLQMPMLNDEARKQIESGRKNAIEENKNPINRVGQAAGSFSLSIFGYAFLAAIFLLFVVAMGGKINFWQAFSVAVYAFFPIAVIRFLLNTLVLFLKDPVDIHPILGQSQLVQDNLGILVNPGEHPVLFVLLASLSLLWFYWIWLNATGLKVAGEKVSVSAGWTATIFIYLALVVVGIISAFLFPSFMS